MKRLPWNEDLTVMRLGSNRRNSYGMHDTCREPAAAGSPISFGKDLIGESWDRCTVPLLDLDTERARIPWGRNADCRVVQGQHRRSHPTNQMEGAESVGVTTRGQPPVRFASALSAGELDGPIATDATDRPYFRSCGPGRRPMSASGSRCALQRALLATARSLRHGRSSKWSYSNQCHFGPVVTTGTIGLPSSPVAEPRSCGRPRTHRKQAQSPIPLPGNGCYGRGCLGTSTTHPDSSTSTTTSIAPPSIARVPKSAKRTPLDYTTYKRRTKAPWT